MTDEQIEREKEMRETKETLDFYQVITDILDVFIATEIGGAVEYNNEVIAAYITSLNCHLHFFDANTKEEIYQQFTDDILNGYPVWQMVKLPEWTKRMVEKTFAAEQADALEKAKKKYKCLTCKFYEEKKSELGTRRFCHNEKCDVNKGFGRFELNRFQRTKGLLRELRCRCKLYEKEVAE